MKCAILFLLTLSACEQDWERRDRLEREGVSPCADRSELLATTAGSPNGYKCPHPKHRMQVQVATTPSNEEIGALVFCKCERDEDGGDK